jgi:hypothetical protein
MSRKAKLVNKSNNLMICVTSEDVSKTIFKSDVKRTSFSVLSKAHENEFKNGSRIFFAA